MNFRRYKFWIKSFVRKLTNPANIVLNSRSTHSDKNILYNYGYVVWHKYNKSSEAQKCNIAKRFGIKMDSKKELYINNCIKALGYGVKISKAEKEYLDKFIFNLGLKQLKYNILDLSKPIVWSNTNFEGVKYSNIQIKNQRTFGFTDIHEIRRSENKDSKYIVYFNGNSQRCLNRIYEAKKDSKRLNCNAVLFDYIGVGQSTGKTKKQEKRFFMTL